MKKIFQLLLAIGLVICGYGLGKLFPITGYKSFVPHQNLVRLEDNIYCQFELKDSCLSQKTNGITLYQNQIKLARQSGYLSRYLQDGGNIVFEKQADSSIAGEFHIADCHISIYINDNDLNENVLDSYPNVLLHEIGHYFYYKENINRDANRSDVYDTDTVVEFDNV